MSDLDAIYKSGNVTSHEEGLRLVYEKGRYDATPRVADPIEPLVIDNLSTVFDPTPQTEVVGEVVETTGDNNHAEQSTIISETNT